MKSTWKFSSPLDFHLKDSRAFLLLILFFKWKLMEIPFKYSFLIIMSFHSKTTWNQLNSTSRWKVLYSQIVFKWKLMVIPLKAHFHHLSSRALLFFSRIWFQVEKCGNSTWNFPLNKLKFHLKNIGNPLNSTWTTTLCLKTF